MKMKSDAETKRNIGSVEGRRSACEGEKTKEKAKRK